MRKKTKKKPTKHVQRRREVKREQQWEDKRKKHVAVQVGPAQRMVMPSTAEEYKQLMKEPTAAEKKATAQRNAVIDDAVAQIRKQYGKGAVMSLTQQKAMDEKLECIPTGFQPIDDILSGATDEAAKTINGTGLGLPRGRIIELFGPESSGKTTLTLHLIAAAQKAGGVCAFVDAEHALDTQYALKLGVDLSPHRFLMSQPDSGEEALNIVDTLTSTGKVDLVVVDSVANLVPQAELDGEVGDHHVGLQSRLMGQALRKLTAKVSRTKTILIFINQIRMKVGVKFGNPETTPGGNALKFYASIRLDIRNVGQLKRSGRVIGNRSKLRTVKNKVVPPKRACFLDIHPPRGITLARSEYDPFLKDDDNEADNE